MKRLLWIFPVILGFCLTARGQEIPQWELYGGYTYMRANFSGPGSSFGLNGGRASLGENVNSWFGARLEIDAFGGTVGGTNVSAQTYTFGPVFSYRKFERFTPFADVQFGDVHASDGYLGISTSANKFAMKAGGGADININERAAIRVQADYVLTRFLSMRQDNIQVSTGLVIRFGRK